LPLFRWTVTDGLQRLDISLEPQLHNSQPEEVLRHIRAVSKPGIYVLLDFHPYLEDPVNVRLLKDICIRFNEVTRYLIMVSHRVTLPVELEGFSARFEMALPTDGEREEIIKRVAAEWTLENPGSQVQADPKAYKLLIQNLAGLTDADTEKLARNAIFFDGAISKSDLPDVMKAKYELLNRGGILQFEYDTAKFSDVGGLSKLKDWLATRRTAFVKNDGAPQLDPPKGILLIGVQGCGKSLAAKATAGIFGAPLLRLDFATLYNKYHGETERNLRESLSTADVMAPCVLWIDEIEKGFSVSSDDPSSSRVFGAFLTWLAEKQTPVFVVATANDVVALPPELLRRGRFDDLFFVDLPTQREREEILAIHLLRRGRDPLQYRIAELAAHSERLSGAELEQVVISALYSAFAESRELNEADLENAIHETVPLYDTYEERIKELRDWARTRARAAPVDAKMVDLFADVLNRDAPAESVDTPVELDLTELSKASD